MADRGPFKALKRDEIRLLAISPGLQTEPLSGSLQTHSLDSARELYTAISYPWGPPEDPRMICLIDESEIEIRQNAHQILTKLRQSTSTILVWIDVLCINQRDKDEKRSQILLMYKIYKLAGCTAIWLGLSDAATEQVVEFANSLDAVKIMPEIRAEVRYGELYTRQRGKSFILDTLSRHPRKTLLITACARLFRAPWLSRVWIRQEAAIGTNPYVLWGAYQMTWNQVAMLAWVFKPALTFTWPNWFEPNYAEIEPAIYAILSVERCRQYDQGGEVTTENSLFGLMLDCRSGLTTKAHDKVYAMLSMASDVRSLPDNEMIQPNYRLSWQEVYVGIARYFFEHNSAARMPLNHAGMLHQGVNSDLPSWVPDWRYPSWTQFAPIASWSAGGHAKNKKCKVATLTKQQRRRLCSFKGFASILPICSPLPKTKLPVEESASKAAQCLEIMALMQDSIEYLSMASQWYYDNDFKPYAEEIAIYDEQNLNFLQRLGQQYYITGEKLRHAYNATIITTQDLQENLASDDFIADAESWRKWLQEGAKSSECPAYHKAVENSFIFRRYKFCWTKTGFMALVPSITQLEDVVVVLNAYRMPFVLRPVQGYFQVIGQCYVHGMMENNCGVLIEEFKIKFEEGQSRIKRPDGDVRRNQLKLDAGRYVDILHILGERWIKLI